MGQIPLEKKELPVLSFDFLYIKVGSITLVPSIGSIHYIASTPSAAHAGLELINHF